MSNKSGISTGEWIGIPILTWIKPSPIILRVKIPEAVSTIISDLLVNPLSDTNLAKQRAPLPHADTSVPSELKILYLKSTFSDSSTSNSWSNPIPK